MNPYQKATTPPSVLEEKEAKKALAEESNHFAKGIETQNYQQWLNHSVTQALIKHLCGQSIELMLIVKSAACGSTNTDTNSHLVKCAAMCHTIDQIVLDINNNQLTKQ